MGRVKPKRAARAGLSAESITAYLHLLKKTLVRYPLTDEDRAMRQQISGIAEAQLREIDRWLDVSDGAAADCPNVEERAAGRDLPASAETMIGLFRMDNLHSLLLDVLQSHVKGDVIEVGVWRGGAAIFMRAIVTACGEAARRVWVADSFQGLPRPDPQHYPADAGDSHWQHPELAVALDVVKANFQRYGLLQQQVRFLPGWFRDTLPTAPIQNLALLRIDGDMYESTIVALNALYPKLQPRGYVIIDDYGALASCRRAVNDFRHAHSISDPLMPIDWTGVAWRRT